MAERTWKEIKVRYCKHAGCNVALEAEVIYPADLLPDQPPHVGSHRCSHGGICMRMGEAACIWAGTNPAYDPFQELE